MSLSKIRKAKSKECCEKDREECCEKELHEDECCEKDFSEEYCEEKSHFNYQGNAILDTKKVCVEIESKEDNLPSYQDNFVILKVATPPSPINPRITLEVDYGFKLSSPKGYKFEVETALKFLEKGAVARVVEQENVVKVFVYNGGKEIISFKEGDVFARAYLVPTTSFVPKVNLEE